MAKRVNYLNNKDMLAEIHKSKTSFSYYTNKNYTDFDVIVHNINEITNEIIQLARESQAKRMRDGLIEKAKSEAKDAKEKKAIKTSEIVVDPASIELKDLVFRVMGFDHIPEDPGRKRNPKTVADRHIKLPFPPFKHYAYIDKKLTEVGRSHWRRGLQKGKFSLTHGEVTNKLALMYIKLVERYSQRSNWRGYTYVDEMRGQALLQLSQIGLQFDESKSQNPFAYYTAAITNSFTRILNVEKRNQNIRDDMLQHAGAMPSFTRQMKHEEEQKALRAQKLADEKGEEKDTTV